MLRKESSNSDCITEWNTVFKTSSPQIPYSDDITPIPPKTPTIKELLTISKQFNLNLSEEEARQYQESIEEIIELISTIDLIIEPKLPVKYPRTPGARPTSEENPTNGWAWLSTIHGADEGKLVGKTLAIKDVVAVAGLPMTLGSRIGEGFVPDIDATIVTRILDEGGTVLGKSVTEAFASSYGSFTASTGYIRNPFDPTRGVGGSSSGSAVLVESRAVDMAIGADQGGSIRVPSALTGVFGLKPTFGLVPYTGASSLDFTVDTLGPMANSAFDCALLLEVISGYDGCDPRQSSCVVNKEYTKYLTGNAKGIRVGIVREGFTWPFSEEDVNQMVFEAANQLTKAGAIVKEVSIPIHRKGNAVWFPVSIFGTTETMIRGAGVGVGHKGFNFTQLVDFFSSRTKILGSELPFFVKRNLLLGQYLEDTFSINFYTKAQNISTVLRDAYNQALEDVDILVMPTTPIKAPPLPPINPTLEQIISNQQRNGLLGANVTPFNLTGHPAMNVPIGLSQILPVGMMLVGRLFEDEVVLQVADAFQKISPNLAW